MMPYDLVLLKPNMVMVYLCKCQKVCSCMLVWGLCL